MRQIMTSQNVASWIAIALLTLEGGTIDIANAQTPSPIPTRISMNSQSSQPCTEAKKPVITKPANGERVVLNDLIRGTTPCSTMKHYVIVTPSNGVNWVQSKPFSIDPNGIFSTEAQFGEGSIGIGEKYIVRVLVTTTTLSPGQLRQMPTDAVLSGAITVTRE